jgi:hypothetical protein
MKVQDNPITFMETRLTWMKENQPDYLLELYRENQLGNHLYNKIQEAKAMEKELEQKGLNEDQVEEYVLELLTPAEAMSETMYKQMSEKDSE